MFYWDKEKYNSNHLEYNFFYRKLIEFRKKIFENFEIIFLYIRDRMRSIIQIDTIVCMSIQYTQFDFYSTRNAILLK